MVEKARVESKGFPLRAELEELDPELSLIVGQEEARQRDKLIMIPSESIAPRAVRELLGSVFTNVYAEGYPALRISHEEAKILADVREQLPMHRRYADRRFYKGTEFVDMVESLAQRRVAQLFATDRVPVDEIYANVQPLSGAAANNAVYEALLESGDTIMGMALSHGGHLTHGSPYNRSGRHYRVVPYMVNAKSGRLDYEEIRQLALANRPRLIVAGASAYPWEIDWAALRAITNEVPGARLLADIAHPAGLVVAGLFPNPIDYAHVVTFTTHKTLCGPRGAVILTSDEALARKIDRAVFPGEQGGPHVNNIAAMAVAFRIAQMDGFRALQRQIVANARALAATLQGLGVPLVYGGTSTHMLLVDLNALHASTSYPLKGDVASRILDIAGIVCNKNTIPGDASAAQASGLRFGTVWASQRGLHERDMERLGEIIHATLTAIVPFRYFGPDGDLARGKLPFERLKEARRGVDELLGMVPEAGVKRQVAKEPAIEALEVSGPRARLFLQESCTANVLCLQPGQHRKTAMLDPKGSPLAELVVTRLGDDQWLRARYALTGGSDKLAAVQEWCEALSDGYVIFDEGDVEAKVEGPVVVGRGRPGAKPEDDLKAADGNQIDLGKPYFVGQSALLAKEATAAKPKELFVPASYAGETRRSSLYEEHLRINGGRNMVAFAGWTMPLWYTSIREEHRAVREAAGLFDISHMGVLEIRGPDAGRFLDLVTTNYVPSLSAGQSHYSYILDPDGNVLDDVFLYCRARDRYMLVVNAANAELVESWLHAVNSKRCLIDRDRPGVAVDVRAEIRDLKDAALGDEGRVDIALQGPTSLQILMAAIDDAALREGTSKLRKTEFVEGKIGAVPVLISRTGYTGEDIGFELYVPPARAPMIWRRLLEVGAPLGLRPTGLGARDSTRAEAGFPLYGHELAGRYAISPAGAGYSQFVKLHKPFFVGRRAFMQTEERRTQEVVRFRLDNKGARMLRHGDPVVDGRGECLGHVTSSVVVDGMQVGMAYVARDRLRPGNALKAFPLSRIKDGVEKPKSEIAIGDVVLLAEDGVVQQRFGLRAQTA